MFNLDVAKYELAFFDFFLIWSAFAQLIKFLIGHKMEETKTEIAFIWGELLGTSRVNLFNRNGQIISIAI